MVFLQFADKPLLHEFRMAGNRGEKYFFLLVVMEAVAVFPEKSQPFPCIRLILFRTALPPVSGIVHQFLRGADDRMLAPKDPDRAVFAHLSTPVSHAGLSFVCLSMALQDSLLGSKGAG